MREHRRENRLTHEASPATNGATTAIGDEPGRAGPTAAAGARGSSDTRDTPARPTSSRQRPAKRRETSPPRKAHARTAKSDASDANESPAARATAWTIVALLSLTPLVVLPDAKEAFRLGQGLLAGWLGLVSLVIASWTLRSGGSSESPRVTLATLWARPAVRAVVPLAIVVAAGGLFTQHQAHFRAACADFLIGASCLAGWSLALDERTLRRLLFWTMPVAVVVALLGLDQVAGLFGTLDWLHVEAETARLRITSTIGNPGDLAALMVLPALVGLDRWRLASPGARVALCIAIPLFVGIIAVTATLAAGISLAVGALAWWWLSSPNPRRLRTPLLAALAIVVVVVGGVAVIAPLRTRVVEKSIELSHGNINALLTGRLDGWRVAWAMLWRSPVTGVGQGAFRVEYADTRLALEARGVAFYNEQLSAILATPHNEALSVGAEQGLPGLIALAWGIWIVFRGARRLRDPASRGLAWAGLSALATLCVVSFPLHVPSVAWPWLLFLAWLFRVADDADADGDGDAEKNTAWTMTGRQLFPWVFGLLLIALGWQTLRANDRITASRMLAAVEARTQAAIQARHAPSTLFAEHLAWLDAAGRMDPLEIGVPIARGSQFLLLRRADDALAAYRHAEALEPRPEIDLNIGRALMLKGDREHAREAFARAVQLNPRLRAEVPPGLLDR